MQQADPSGMPRQAVLILRDRAPIETISGGKCFLWWKLRELQRFGIDDVVVVDPAGVTDPRFLRALCASLPKPSRLSIAANAAEAVTHAAPEYLETEGDTLFSGNLAQLLKLRRPAELVLEDGTPASVSIRSRRVSSANMADRVAVPGLLETASSLSGDLSIRLRRPALFFDRDGVLNEDHGYVGTRDRFVWMEGALAAIRRATEAGWHVFAVTNQSGIARGFYSEDDATILMSWMADQAMLHGGTIDDMRYCPFHPEAVVPAYRRSSPWRKPEPGMLLDLIARWDLDPRRCLMIGDQVTDIQAADKARMRSALFAGGDLDQFIADRMPEIGVDFTRSSAEAAGNHYEACHDE